jgi:putative MATE family efflux protein
MFKNQEEMGNERIGKLLVKFASPAIIGMMSSALYNITDTIFVGRGVGAKGIAAIVIAYPIQMFLLAFTQAVGVGAASLISRSLGARDNEKAQQVAGLSLTVVAMMGVCFTLLGLLFMQPLAGFLGAGEDILPYVTRYVSVILYGSFFYMASLSTSFVVRAEGKPKIAMFAVMAGTLLNVVLDPVFILWFKMGIKGAATATVISQFVSALYLTVYFLRGKSSLKLAWHHFRMNLKLLGGIISIGISAFVRIASMLLFFVVLNKTITYFGTYLHLAVIGVYNRVVSLITLPLFGIAQGLQPVAGFNFGAKKFDRVKEALKLSGMAATVLCTTGFLVLLFFPGTVMRIFINEPEIIEKGIPIMRVLIMMLPVVGFHQVSTSFFQSIGKAMPSLILSISRQVMFIIPLLLILPRIYGLQGIWYAVPIADLFAILLTIVLVNREFKGMPVTSGVGGAFEK